MSWMGFQTSVHTFNQKRSEADSFVRSKVGWSHILLGRLHAIYMEYAWITGEALDDTSDQMTVVERDGVYGRWRIQLRLHQRVWLSGYFGLGSSGDGFITGGRGILTLGRPWASNVDIGAEYFQDLGPSVWMRVQSDRLAPVIVGATIMRTKLPSTALANGNMFEFDMRYTFVQRVAVRLSVSAGARDAAFGYGGGMGVSMGF